MSKLTTEDHWVGYWHSKPDVVKTSVNSNYLFSDIINSHFIYDKSIKFIEIGGFPGFFSIWFSMYLVYQATILDLFIDRTIIKALCDFNKIDEVQSIKGDITKTLITNKFDVVMSAGLIEHFNDLKSIIEHHSNLLAPSGSLILGVPNFLGLNGFIQKYFDSKNYFSHNLDAMNILLVNKLLIEMNFDVLHSDYYGNFGIWLESSRIDSKFIKYIFYIINLIRIPLNYLGIETKLTSPYIIFIAKKNEYMAN